MPDPKIMRSSHVDSSFSDRSDRDENDDLSDENDDDSRPETDIE